MKNKKIKSFSKLVENLNITSSNISTAIKNKTVSEKYVRSIEQHYGLPNLFFDSYDDIVLIDVYTLTTFDKKIVTSRIKNINISNECFYIQLVNPSFYPAAAHILFKKIKKSDRLLPNRICLIKKNNKYLIAKNKISHFLLYNNQELNFNDVHTIAEEIKIEF